MIGWYVHHHGRGHLTRARAVQAWLDEPVTVLSSLPRPADTAAADWLELALDTDDGPGGDVTAHAALHWVPVGSTGLQQRMASIAQWIREHRPRLMVVDVSVEVALLSRLCGVPVVVVAGPGDRTDGPHQLGYDIADHIIAPWARSVYDPPFLHRHAGKTSYVGAFSRFDGAVPAPAGPDVLVLSGAGGSDLTAADLDQARAAVPSRRWIGVGAAGQPWHGDVWPALSGAAVVVTHAGQNALAEVAAARRPAVVVAQQRPFDEQVRVAAALAEHRIAINVPHWPSAADWPDVLAAALELGGDGWRHWSTGHGAEAAAGVLRARAAGVAA